MNWKGSSRLFGTFVKNLFLGPFTVARVSARVEEIHHRALTPSSDADTAECRADNSGDQLKGRRSWWPTAFALACFFYGSIACQVRLEFFRKLTKFLIFDSDFPPKLKAFLIHRIFPLKSAIRRSLDLACVFIFIIAREFFIEFFFDRRNILLSQFTDHWHLLSGISNIGAGHVYWLYRLCGLGPVSGESRYNTQHHAIFSKKKFMGTYRQFYGPFGHLISTLAALPEKITGSG